MNDVPQNPKPRTNVQNLIARPFLVILVPLIWIIAPVLKITRNPYADYAMPVAIILMVVMFSITLLYNKIWLGVWLPGRKKDSI